MFYKDLFFRRKIVKNTLKIERQKKDTFRSHILREQQTALTPVNM